ALFLITGCSSKVVQPITPNSQQFTASHDCKITNGIGNFDVNISSKDIFYEIIIEDSGETKKIMSRDYHLPAYEVDDEYYTTGKTYAYIHQSGTYIVVINTRFNCDRVKFTKKYK
ncbi:MAG: hypothetical protein PHE67_09665, partial [Campylobacterales bacterium]|nr:hypothetical protein [Campylobacterales bacterium]